MGLRGTVMRSSLETSTSLNVCKKNCLASAGDVLGMKVKEIKPCVIISHHGHDLVCYINTDHQVSVQLPVCWFESDAFDCKLRNDIIRKDSSFMVLISLVIHTIISDSWILDL